MKFQYVLLLLSLVFLSCKDKNELNLLRIEGKQIKIDSTIVKDNDLEKFISPYKNAIDAEMNKVLCYNLNAMFKTDTPNNTAIGNMMADAVLEIANPIFIKRYKDTLDGVLLNYGGIRAGISKGNITTRTAYEIMPFENMVVVAQLDGTQVKALFNYLAKSKKAQPIANMELVINKNNEITVAKIDGKEIDDHKLYHIATSDYLVEGGDNMSFFLKSKKVLETDYKLRKLFIDYFEKQDTINYKADKRLVK